MPESHVKKLKSPLYCACWVKDYLLVAGGGGRQSTGLPNSIWCLRHTSQGIGDVAAQYSIDGDAPMRMLASRSQNFVLLAMGFGGLLRVDMDLTATPPVFSMYEGESQQSLQAIGMVNCLSFSSTNQLLAVGLRDGPVQVLEWPSLVVKVSLEREAAKASAKAPREVAFSNAHGSRVIVVIYEDGSCVLWDIQNQFELTQLALPPELKGCSFSRIRSSPNLHSNVVLYTVVNGHRSSYLVQWTQDRVGNISPRGFQKAYKTAITAFDLSKSGSYLGVGTSDGDVAIFDAETLQPVKKVKQGHMVFCTAVAFSSAEEGLLSVSGDASVRTTPCRKSRNLQRIGIMLAILILIVALLLGYLQSRTF